MRTLTVIIMILLVSKVCPAQDSVRNESRKFFYEGNFNSINSNEGKAYERKFDQQKKINSRENIEVTFFKSKVREKQTFDLLSTVGSNISFGGFWDRYAVINFTPQLNIKPLSFINIYANHNLNCFIPINAVQEYYQTVLIQSIAILAIDRSVNLVLDPRIWITDVIAFAAKNLIMNFLIKPSIDNSSKTAKPMLQFENYYYSMSITF